MPAGSRRVVWAVATALIVALAAPAAALAGGGGTCSASACKVYHEGGTNSGGQKPPTQKPTGSNKSGGGQHQPRAPKSYSRVLQHAGKDRGALKNLLNGDATIGTLPSGSGGGSPGLFGAAFDLGAGPTILLAILLGIGLGVAARGSVGGWLSRRSSS